jgi:hypothetical protein
MQRVFSGGIDEATFQNWVAKEAESIKEFERRVKCLIEIVASEDKYFDHEPVEALQIIDNNVSGKNRVSVSVLHEIFVPSSDSPHQASHAL